MLNKVSELEAKLTPEELRDRAKGFSQLRVLIETAAQAGGASAPIEKTFPYTPQKIRVDLQVIVRKGMPTRLVTG